MKLRTAALVAVGLFAAVAVTPSRAAAPTTATRGISLSYSQAGGVHVGTASTITRPGQWQDVGATEDRVKVAGHDASGLPIAIALEYQPFFHGETATRLVCGTSVFLRVAHGSQLRVTPVAGRCVNGDVSLPTSGSISLTFVRPLPQPSKVIPASRRWAVVAGVSKYAGRTHPTVGGVGDVDAIRSSLLAAGWRSDHVLVLKDGQASGQALIDAMGWLADHSTANTYSLFHFSGHACISSRGSCPPGHTYLWGADNRFVAETTVASVLGKVRGHAWFDFAACESGAFDAGLHSRLRLVTAASQADETAYEKPSWKQSIWTGLVFDRAYLQGYAGPSRRKATIGQMVTYGKREAPSVSSNGSRGPQHPYAAGGDPTQSLFAPHV